MAHAGTSRKSPNDAPWETLSLTLSRPISAPLLTAALSWRYEEKVVELVRINVKRSHLKSPQHIYGYMDRQSVCPNKARTPPGLSGLLRHKNGTTPLGSLEILWKG